jgi:hypothetical protein
MERILMTHSKDNIPHVHDTQNDVANPKLVRAIAHEDQGAGNDVMEKHLGVVLSFFLNIYDQDLLNPKRKLDEIVPFQETSGLADRPVSPHAAEIEPVLGVVHEIL